MTMKYSQQLVHPEAIARFGELETSRGIFEMPAVSPALRTAQDVKALLQNMAMGGVPPVISPYLSCRRVLVPALTPLFEQNGTVNVQRPLVVPDIESEALSINCTARLNFQNLPGMSTTVAALMTTGLTSDVKKGRHEYGAMWRHVGAKFGYSAIVSWQTAHLTAMGSDVLMLPTPLIRASTRSAGFAFEVAKDMLPFARANPRFLIHGIQLLIHAEVTRTTADARLTRAAIVQEVESWLDQKNAHMRGLFLAIKVYDPNNYLSDPSEGSIMRQKLSEFVSQLQAAVAAAQGVLVVHNFGPWALGLLDSGADIVSGRLDGKMRIDVPMSGGGKSGPRPTPMIYGSRSLGPITADAARIVYEKTGAFPVPSCVPPEPWWNMKYGEATVYAHRTCMGVLVELGHEYRDAGLDPTMLLGEAVRSRVRDSDCKQALQDLCPSL